MIETTKDQARQKACYLNVIAKKKHNSLHSIQKDKSSLLLSSNIDAAVVSGT